MNVLNGSWSELIAVCALCVPLFHLQLLQMVPFFYLHAESDDEPWDRSGRDAGPRGSSCDMDRPQETTCLSVFGKDSAGGTIVLRIKQYRLHFYASFGNARIARSCCSWLLGENNRNETIVSIKSVGGYKSMLIDENHVAPRLEDYGDTTLCNAVRIQVRTRRNIGEVIESIDKKVSEFCMSNEERKAAVKYYESNMDVITIATRNLKLDACSWYLLDAQMCHVGENQEYTFYDIGQLEPRELFHKPAPNESPNGLLPPYVKILSFDLECLSSDVETMPDARKDPIIQISSVISADALGRCTANDSNAERRGGVEHTEKNYHQDNHAFQRVLFTIGGSCSEIEDVQVVVCRNERELLIAFGDHVAKEDPDILTGYNIDTFDFPYLFERFAHHCVNPNFGRGRRTASCKRRNHEMVCNYASFVPKSHTTRVPGRVLFDLYTYTRKEVVLRSYTLNHVAAHFLGKKKDDVSYGEIPTLFKGDADTRARLGRYCVKDAQLVLEIAFKTQTFVHAFERCKVFRTMLKYMVERGQQVRFYSMLLAWCAERMILVDDVTSSKMSAGNREEKSIRREDSDRSAKRSRTRGPSGPTLGKKRKSAGYDGATVLEPMSGLYHTPVVCLDYASLYPSIMIAHNLCFTTFVRDVRCGEELTRQGLAEVTPAGHYFLKARIKKGVLPSILEMLLEERSAVRARMTGLNGNCIEHKLLDGQQSALKMAANSIYGAIGCDQNVLNFVEIPSSVTAYGRRLILITKEHVESRYGGTKVVYGDTDSVMVNLTEWDSRKRHIWECAEIGKEMADSMTRLIDRPPIRLQFETVYKPFLLCTKKRYAAGVYNNLDRLAAMGVDEALESCKPTVKYKGLQVVRRDNCPFSTRLMRSVLESLMCDEMSSGVTIESILHRLRGELSRLFKGQVDMDELVISKEWKKRGAATAQAHDRLAQRMQQRDPNSAPAVGDRIPYVVVTSSEGAKLCDRAEDPSYVVKNRLQVDFLYYADNQVAKPVAELLRIATRDQRSLEDIKDSFWPVDAPRRTGDRRRTVGERTCWTRKASIGSHCITDYFSACTSGEK